MRTLIFQNQKNKVEFGVDKIPNRKNKALIKRCGAIIEPLAYFRNEECAKEFNRMLDLIYEMQKQA